MSQKKFSVICNTQASPPNPSTLGTIINSATVRCRVYGFDVGSDATPADQAWTAVIARFTAVGTAGSGPTPQPLDNAEVAAVCTAGIAHSAEPTYTSPFLYQVPLNQRASWRFVANPDYEFMGAATASNGVGLKEINQTASFVVRGTIFFWE